MLSNIRRRRNTRNLFFKHLNGKQEARSEGDDISTFITDFIDERPHVRNTNHNFATRDSGQVEYVHCIEITPVPSSCKTTQRRVPSSQKPL